MLSRLIPKPSHFRRFLLIPSKSLSYPQPHFTYSASTPHFGTFSKYFSTNGDNNNNGKGQSISSFWKDFRESEGKYDARFAEDSGSLAGFNDMDEGTKAPTSKGQWWLEEKGLDNEDEDALFKGVDKKAEEKGGRFGDHQWMGAEDLKPWTLREEGKEDVFNFQDVVRDVGKFSPDSGPVEGERSEDAEKLEKEEQALTVVLKGKLNCLFYA